MNKPRFFIAVCLFRHSASWVKTLEMLPAFQVEEDTFHKTSKRPHDNINKDKEELGVDVTQTYLELFLFLRTPEEMNCLKKLSRKAIATPQPKRYPHDPKIWESGAFQKQRGYLSKPLGPVAWRGGGDYGSRGPERPMKGRKL